MGLDWRLQLLFNLMAHLPTYYKNSAVMQQIQAANATELQTIDDKLNDVLEQYFISTADTTLDRWEKELSLPSGADKPTDQRRSIIIAKLRGAGTTTAQLLKTTALAYTNGEIDVIDDAANNTVKIKFVSIIGLPPNIDDLKTSIDDIVPAHLLIQWEYKYNTHGDLSQYTNAYLALFTHDELFQSDISVINYSTIEGQSINNIDGVI